MASSTGTPVLVSLASTSSSDPRLSDSVARQYLHGGDQLRVGVHHNRRLVSVEGLLLLLCPWRISGSCTDIIRSRLTPSLRLTPSSVRSTSWSSNCPSNSAAATIC